MRIGRIAYRLWQALWGFPQTAAGLFLFLVHVRKPHFSHHGAIVTIWNMNAGLSLGMFVFLNAWPGSIPEDDGLEETRGCAGTDERMPSDHPPARQARRFVEYLPGIVLDDRLLVHEYGHTIQSLVLGPLYLPIIGLPSVIWLNSARLARRRRERHLSYYAFFTERSANSLGELALKRPSMGQAFID